MDALSRLKAANKEQEMIVDTDELCSDVAGIQPDNSFVTFLTVWPTTTQVSKLAGHLFCFKFQTALISVAEVVWNIRSRPIALKERTPIKIFYSSPLSH